MTEPLRLTVPPPPEGHGEWKYALVGKKVADTPEGEEFIAKLQADGILVEIMTTPPGDGYQALFQPQVPRQAQLRAFHPEEGIEKP